MHLPYPPAKLMLIRHAESWRNRIKGQNFYFADEESRKPVKGIPDYSIGLTPEGDFQAMLLGRALAAKYPPPDVVIHSGYVRTKRTMELALAAYPESDRGLTKIEMCDLVRERDPGYAYDMTEAEAHAAFPWLQEHRTTFGGFLMRPPGGESLLDVSGRIRQFLQTDLAAHAGKTVWIFTHGGPFRCFRFLLFDWPIERARRWGPGEQPGNCAIDRYSWGPGGVLAGYALNEVLHP